MAKFLSLLSVIIILGSLSFYFYALTTPVIWFLALVCLVLILKWRQMFNLQKSDFHWKSDFKILVFITIIAAAFYTLFTHQTTAAFRSPWEAVPPYFFLLYGAAIFITITRLLRSARNDNKRGVTHCGAPARVPAAAAAMPSERGAMGQDPEQSAAEGWSWLPIALLTFLTLSISLFIFPLGSGFDPFIHQATEKIIAATGTITPKPLYYIGQYTLVVFLSKILGISIVWIDKLLVPLLAALLLPWSIMHWIKNTWRSAGSPLETIADASMEQSERGGEGKPEREFSTAAVEGHSGGFPRRAPPGSPTRERVSTWGSAERPLAIFAFLLLPFLLTPFTTTTPYSLALLFLVVLIFHVTCNTKHVTNLLLAIATLLIHPLVGIPACIFLLISYLQKYKNKLLHVTCYMLCALAIPLAFLLAAQLSLQIHINLSPQNFLPWLRSIEWSGIYRENRFNAPLDLLYFYGFNIKNIFWFFVLTCIILHYRQRGRSAASPLETIADASMERSERGGEGKPRAWLRLLRQSVLGGLPRRAPPGSPTRKRVSTRGAAERTLITTFLILLISYAIMSGFMSFDFLIGYEQADYAKRVLDIAQLFLLPLFLLGIHWWLQRIIWKLEIGNWKLATQTSGVIILTLLITGSLYLTYPQKVDSYAVSHAFNTSQADIDAVRWIDADAHGEDYIVLANQAVSVGAIRELGFKKYYNNIFFYPIPTGSPLYQYYLDMVYPPKFSDENVGRQVKNRMEAVMQDATKLVGAQRGYFVLNRYWSDFDRIFAEAQENLQLLHSINNAVFIFTIR